jgi:hypothetical protein
MNNYKFEAGDIIAFSHGEYSDYIIQGIFKATMSIDLAVLLERYNEKEAKKNRGMSFIGWLNKQQLIEEILYREVWTGAYGETTVADY